MKFEVGKKYILKPKETFPPLSIEDMLDEKTIRCPKCGNTDLLLSIDKGHETFLCKICKEEFDPEKEK